MYKQLLERNLNVYFGDQYMGIPLQLGEEYHIEEYLVGTYNTIFEALNEYPNTCVVRVDLRLPMHYRSSNDYVIRRFFEFLQELLNTDLQERKEAGQQVASCNIRYVAARDRNKFNTEQYHVLLMFNLDVYNCIGAYRENVGGNMAERIRMAWAEALSNEVEYIARANLVNVPKNPVLYINYVKGNSFTFEYELKEIFKRFSYFTTIKDKSFNQGYTPFLCSAK
ncbi:inovirus Gp2 family protein [Colwellia sp. 20A7]|uniref:inovirus Gp2 family protein n=1 Tax=Colwellia sp. 20A7 TaxID=2689569 RepID=UPI00135716FB|nr:inovirus Gp2 family protein [Colwellia sp. 20A7]